MEATKIQAIEDAFRAVDEVRYAYWKDTGTIDGVDCSEHPTIMLGIDHEETGPEFGILLTSKTETPLGQWLESASPEEIAAHYTSDFTNARNWRLGRKHSR